MKIERQKTAFEGLRDILAKKGAGTQEELREELEKEGFEVNQSTISRNLRKLGAIKTFNPSGEAQYKLPDDEAVPAVESSVSDLVTDIVHNETLIVIHTRPGSASLIARNLDHFESGNILGTIAGDDTIFVATPSGKSLKKVAAELKRFLGCY